MFSGIGERAQQAAHLIFRKRTGEPDGYRVAVELEGGHEMSIIDLAPAAS